MQCAERGATLTPSGSYCPNCHASVTPAKPVSSVPVDDEATWVELADRFFAKHIQPRARLVIGISVAVVVMVLLLAWHPWHRPVKPSPYSFPINGTSALSGTTWTPGSTP